MEPKNSSPFTAPSASTDPPPSESTSQECLSALGFEDHTKAVQCVISRHPQILQFLRPASLTGDSTAGRLERLNQALEFSRPAINSTSFTLFHAALLFELALARNDASLYDAVVRKCEQALLLENLTEPECKVQVLAERLEKMSIRKLLMDLVGKSKRRLILLGGGNRRDNWKRLVQDNILEEVKAKFVALIRLKKDAAGWRPSDFKKHKKLESNVATITRVRAFWNNSMSVDEKRALLRIRIKDLKAYLDKNDLRMAKEVLTEAIDYAENKKIWKDGLCFECGECVLKSDSENDLGEHIRNHLRENFGTINNSYRPPECTNDTFEDGIWKPVKLICAAEIMNSGSAPSDWPYVEDSERTKIIERIRAKLQFLRAQKCFAFSLFKVLQDMIINFLQKHNHNHKSLITDLWVSHTLYLIRFLEAPDLKIVLAFLDELTLACFSPCLILSEKDHDQQFWRNSRVRIDFSSDFSTLLLDDRLLRGETVEPDIGIAVVTSIAEDCDADYCDSESVLSWLWTEGPTIDEQIRAWTSQRKDSQNRGKLLYKILRDEYNCVVQMSERKGNIFRYQTPLENVERLCLDENRKREQMSCYIPQGYLSLLFNRWTDLIKSNSEGDNETEGAAELDIIWSIMKEEGMEIQIAINWLRNRMYQKLCQLDSRILATFAATKQTMTLGGRVCMFDYRVALVPLLKSFMKARLEDLVNKEDVVINKDNAAANAMLLLAEVAPKKRRRSNYERDR